MRFSSLAEPVNEQCDPAESQQAVYVGLEHIDSGALWLSRFGSPADVQSSKSRFKRGDILYGKLRPYLDKAVLMDRDGICSTDILVFRPTTNACPAFIVALIHSAAFLSHAVSTTHGLNHPRTSWAALSEFEWEVPRKSEQERIAAVLWKVQKAIEGQDKLVRTARELKQATMRQVFSHGLRNEPLKETEIGPVPESWKYSALGDLCSKNDGAIQTGPFGSQLHAREYQDTGVPVVNPTHLLGNRINHEDIPLISRQRAKDLARHALRKGDILFARRGQIGRHGFISDKEEGWLCGTGCFLVRINHPDIENEYLPCYFSNAGVVAWLEANAAGAIMPNLNNTVLGWLPIYFPTEKAEQNRIAHILRILSNKIAMHERKRVTLQDLFKTLLHKLMTAQIRVHKLDIDTSEVTA